MLPFIRAQKLYVLKPEAEPRVAVHPEQFHATRHQNTDRDDSPSEPDASLWEELAREDLLADASPGQPLHRIALTTDAGLGKSYNLSWMCYEWNDPARRLVAFVLPIGALQSPADLIAHHLVPAVRDTPGNHHEKPAVIQACLERLRDSGRLVLLFDGLDMASDASVAHLATLLAAEGEWARCRIVVAGRPFALDRHWPRLFADRSWSYVQIAEFDSDLQRLALGQVDGRDRYDFIPDEARTLLTIPRVLEFLQPLGIRELEKLRTVSDVYWQACGYMLTRTLGQAEMVFDRRNLLALLGALAFTMYTRTERASPTGALRPNLDRILAQNMDCFLDEVLGKLEKAVPRYTEAVFRQDLQTLNRLNSHLNHGWLDVNAVGGRGEPLLWRNASLQEFFAAFWATRWAGTDDHPQLRDWVVDPLSDANRGFYWFWRYGSEMPDEAIHHDSRRAPTAWLDAMGPLYVGEVRSTEFIYRGWERMRRWNPEPFRKYREEFQQILAGNQGPRRQEIARAWLSGFVPLVGTDKPGDTGSFIMGNDQTNLDNRLSVSPYLLHQFCVTNDEYELFDPRHKDRRWIDKRHPAVVQGGDPAADDRCPVVNVSWYDAWCLTRWLGVLNRDGQSYGITLPTEQQWEYACRAGRTTPFTFHAGHDGLSCTPDICNFDGNHSYPKDIKLSGEARAVIYRKATLHVHDLGPNIWGFFQMHGNVWEWCASAKAASRALRGGSWFDDNWNCRSAYRSRDGPGFRDRSIGFRLAAVPASLEPGQVN